MPPFAPSQEFDDFSLGDSCSSFEVQPRKKSVCVDVSLNDVCIIPPVTDMTPHEIASAWFSRADSAIIRDSLLESISRLNNGEYFNETTDSARGLEFFTYKGALKREYNKLRIRRSVLEEQERQKDAGVCDADKLALVASACVGDCTEYALSLAEEDEDYVLCEQEEYEEEILLKKANASRSGLTLCCWDYYGLLCLKRWQ